MKKNKELPVPPHFKKEYVEKIWKVDYQKISIKAKEWAKSYNIKPANDDKYRICLILIDVQNSFCIPDFELFVSGRSGRGAVDDNIRLCEFIYRNLNFITQICPTMDTHKAMQIFHPIYLIDRDGNNPEPFTLISYESVKDGLWRFNPLICQSLGISKEYGEKHLLYYTEELKKGGKYELTVWPYHAMLGSIGHALVSSVEEAIFFHCISRYSQPDFHIKGDIPFTEHYSVFGPEILRGPDGDIIGVKDVRLFNKLIEYDAILIAGQAKSHCVAWTIEDLLEDIKKKDKKLAEKVYILEDCTSPVVVPGIMDYTEEADNAFKKFSEAGMHIVNSTETIVNWPGIKLEE